MTDENDSNPTRWEGSRSIGERWADHHPNANQHKSLLREVHACPTGRQAAEEVLEAVHFQVTSIATKWWNTLRAGLFRLSLSGLRI